MAASRYGWTLHYILWEISWVNLQMMLRDKQETLYGYYDKGKEPDTDVTIEENSSDYYQVNEETSINEINRIIGKK